MKSSSYRFDTTSINLNLDMGVLATIAKPPETPQTLQQVHSWLNNDLAGYANWGTQVGVGMFACVMCASLIGIVIRNL